MQKIKLWKKYADGGLRSLEINDHKESVKHMLANGYFLTEKEAKEGKVEPEEETKPAPKRRKKTVPPIK